MKIVVTTNRKAQEKSLTLAIEIARKTGGSLVERRSLSLNKILADHRAEAVLIASEENLKAYTSQGELFFHPNMAQLRVKNLRLGERDHMVEAMELTKGMKVLDCTLGLGADAIVASFVAETEVVGLESSPVIEAVVAHGLQHFSASNYELHQALRRIKTHNINSLDFLRQQREDSFDIIYFDPMFRHPLEESISLNPLRPVANGEPLNELLIEEAKRVARRRIVMKERAGSQEFERLGFRESSGGKWSKVQYGIIRL